MNSTMMKYVARPTVFLLGLCISPVSSHGVATEAATADKASLAESIDKGVAFLTQAQADDGSFSASSGPGITAIAATALMRSGRTANDPAVVKALEYLEQHRHDDGGI